MRRPRLPAVLEERTFRRLYAARATSLLGDGIAPVALAFAVLDVRGTAGALGVVLAARTLCLVLFVLFGGVLADRLPRQQLMIGADILRGVAQATSAALLISGSARLWQL